MRERWIRWTCVLAVGLCALPLPAQEGGDQDAAMAAMMEAWERARTPGEAHERLAAEVGSFKMAIRMWMDPAGEPMVSNGSAERSMLLGGRVLEERMKSEMMGQPFEGIGRTGYDNVTGRYWSTWIDSMSTACFVMYGSRDESGAITLAGEFDDPATGASTRARSVMHAEKDGKQVLEWYEDRGEGEAKTMEIVYERVGS